MSALLAIHATPQTVRGDFGIGTLTGDTDVRSDVTYHKVQLAHGVVWRRGSALTPPPIAAPPQLVKTPEIAAESVLATIPDRVADGVDAVRLLYDDATLYYVGTERRDERPDMLDVAEVHNLIDTLEDATDDLVWSAALSSLIDLHQAYMSDDDVVEIGRNTYLMRGCKFRPGDLIVWFDRMGRQQQAALLDANTHCPTWLYWTQLLSGNISESVSNIEPEPDALNETALVFRGAVNLSKSTGRQLVTFILVDDEDADRERIRRGA